MYRGKQLQPSEVPGQTVEVRFGSFSGRSECPRHGQDQRHASPPLRPTTSAFPVYASKSSETSVTPEASRRHFRKYPRVTHGRSIFEPWLQQHCVTIVEKRRPCLNAPDPIIARSSWGDIALGFPLKLCQHPRLGRNRRGRLRPPWKSRQDRRPRAFGNKTIEKQIGDNDRPACYCAGDRCAVHGSIVLNVSGLRNIGGSRA